jgi:hypothetical protein
MSLPVNCLGVCRWLSCGEGEDASWPSRVLARAHLAWCAHCRRYRLQLELIGDAARLSRAHRADPERVRSLQTRIVHRLLSGGGSRDDS